MKEKYDETFLLCRDVRHAWEREEALHPVPEYRNAVSRTLTCARCGMQRVDTYVLLKNRVERVGSHYRYPEGYQVPGGLSVEQARLAAFSKMSVVSE